jgi:hypothetical protein
MLVRYTLNVDEADYTDGVEKTVGALESNRLEKLNQSKTFGKQVTLMTAPISNLAKTA